MKVMYSQNNNIWLFGRFASVKSYRFIYNVPNYPSFFIIIIIINYCELLLIIVNYYNRDQTLCFNVLRNNET